MNENITTAEQAPPGTAYTSWWGMERFILVRTRVGWLIGRHAELATEKQLDSLLPIASAVAWRAAAEPVRCAPSREEIVALFHAEHLDPCTGWCEKQAEAVQALYANQRTEAQVKAEAWEEAATWFDADLCGVSLIIRDRANRLPAAQPTPVFEAMGLPTPEVPNVGGEQR